MPQIAEDRDSNKSVYTNVQGSAIHNSQKVELTQVSIDRWLGKPQEVYSCNGCILFMAEYYSAIKGNEILTHATMWINLENIMLHEKSQS